MSYFVRGGTNTNSFGSGSVSNVSSFALHPKYDDQSFENDVAVVYLETVICINSFNFKFHLSTFS